KKHSKTPLPLHERSAFPLLGWLIFCCLFFYLILFCSAVFPDWAFITLIIFIAILSKLPSFNRAFFRFFKIIFVCFPSLFSTRHLIFMYFSKRLIIFIFFWRWLCFSTFRSH